MATAGFSHSVLLRDDGQAVAVGRNFDIPALPAGVRNVACAAGFIHSVLLRDDGRPMPPMMLKPDTTASTWKAERQLSAPPKATFSTYSLFDFLSTFSSQFFAFHFSTFIFRTVIEALCLDSEVGTAEGKA